MGTVTQAAEVKERAQRADARRNHQRVLDAAATCFAELGSDVSVAEIARRAGVGTGTLFRHFPTKHDLLVAVIRQRFGAAHAALEAALAEPDPWTAVTSVVAAGAEIQVRNRCLMELKTAQLMNDPVLAAMRDEMATGLRTLIARAQAAGVLREDVVAEDLPLLMDAIASSARQLGEVRPDLWRRYLAIVLDGLRADGARFTLAEAPPPTLDELAATCRALNG